MPPSTISFPRGPYGEILPPPLISHVTLEEAWQQYKEFKLAINDGPDPDVFLEMHEGWSLHLIFHTHTHRLEAVLTGAARNMSERETQLQACFQRGELLAFPSFTTGEDYPATFVPVLKQLGATSWQFGLPGHGRVVTFEADASDLFGEVKGLYMRWLWEENPAPFLSLLPPEFSGDTDEA